MFQVFSNDLALCLKIKQKSLKTIVRLYSESMHPVWMAVLVHIVVCESFPLKRLMQMFTT